MGPKWANTILRTITEKRVDMIRGKTRVVPPLLPEIELQIKELCDLGNRINAYSELVRLRVREKLAGLSFRGLPIWLPRITGPNIAITRSAYISVGGLDSRCPGDQASLLANPLLQIGGSFLVCEDPDMVLDISYRFSNRERNIGRFYGTLGFGAMLEFVSTAVHENREIIYPNPEKLEDGVSRIISDLKSRNADLRKSARKIASHMVNFPSDPNLLYNYGRLSGRPEYVPVSEAKSMLIKMTARAGGMDYRNAERFLMAREHLRAELLSSEEQQIDLTKSIIWFLEKSGSSIYKFPATPSQPRK